MCLESKCTIRCYVPGNKVTKIILKQESIRKKYRYQATVPLSLSNFFSAFTYAFVAYGFSWLFIRRLFYCFWLRKNWWNICNGPAFFLEFPHIGVSISTRSLLVNFTPLNLNFNTLKFFLWFYEMFTPRMFEFVFLVISVLKMYSQNMYECLQVFNTGKNWTRFV